MEDIRIGEAITEKNVRSIRPGFGMHPKHLKSILGRSVNQNLEKGEPMRFDYLI